MYEGDFAELCRFQFFFAEDDDWFRIVRRLIGYIDSEGGSWEWVHSLGHPDCLSYLSRLVVEPNVQAVFSGIIGLDFDDPYRRLLIAAGCLLFDCRGKSIAGPAFRVYSIEQGCSH